MLKAMNRNPDIEPFIKCMENLKHEKCKVNKHTQILIGYPCETEADVWQTLSALIRCDFDHININKFSKRRGTVVYELDETVREEDKVARCSLIRKIMFMGKKAKLYDAIKIPISMIKTEHIEAIRDSLASVLPLLRELTENSSPALYTVENLWWTKLNVAISITAALIGGLGAFYGYKGFVYAKETARNVVRLPQETYVKLCMSLIQGLLLNYVRAIVIFCNHKDGLKTPSDNYISNFMLPEFEDIFNTELFIRMGLLLLA